LVGPLLLLEPVSLVTKALCLRQHPLQQSRAKNSTSRNLVTRAISARSIARRANRLGFGSTRFHDLRGIHVTALLDAGIPVHTVAQRIGDDPAVLLRNYAKRKRTKTADTSLSNAIEAFAANFLGS
jgi:hypothetical protein